MDIAVDVYVRGAQTWIVADKWLGVEIAKLGYKKVRCLAPRDAGMFCAGWEAAWREEHGQAGEQSVYACADGAVLP